MSIQTKQQRTQLRNELFKSLKLQGYSHEVYKELDIFTAEKETKFPAKVFKGNSTNPIHFLSYRTMESRSLALENIKNSYDRAVQRKEEYKEANKGKSSSHAAAAAEIKEKLKKAFPNVKFSVKSESYAGGDSIDISWSNGPTEDQVKEISGEYQYGHFNSMEDIYEYSNTKDIPQVKYIFERRELTQDILDKAIAEMQEIMTFDADQKNGYNRDSPQEIAMRIFNKTSFPDVYTSFKMERSQISCGFFEDFFNVVFDSQETPPAPTKSLKIEEIKGEINVVQYGKGIAVVGDTKAIKEILKSIGGKFNPHLSIGAGWIFQPTKIDEINKVIDSLKPVEESCKMLVIYNPHQAAAQNVI